jgi:hypothetical protein
VRGALDRVCQVFSNDAKFEIAGASHVSAIAIAAGSINEIRPWVGSNDQDIPAQRSDDSLDDNRRRECIDEQEFTQELPALRYWLS